MKAFFTLSEVEGRGQCQSVRHRPRLLQYKSRHVPHKSYDRDFDLLSIFCETALRDISQAWLSRGIKEGLQASAPAALPWFYTVLRIRIKPDHFYCGDYVFFIQISEAQETISIIVWLTEKNQKQLYLSGRFDTLVTEISTVRIWIRNDIIPGT